MTPEEETAMIAACAPGIRRTVAWLRSLGFDTTDSGDGKANVHAGIEGACEFPMVAISVLEDQPLRSAGSALVFALAARGIPIDGMKVTLEASYVFGSGEERPLSDFLVTQQLILTGVDDAMLFGPQ